MRRYQGVNLRSQHRISGPQWQQNHCIGYTRYAKNLGVRTLLSDHLTRTMYAQACQDYV